MINHLPSHLQGNEQTAVWLLADQLQDFLGDDLCQLWLFGSKARGDFTVDSDVDVLIVLRNLNGGRRGTIRRIAARVSLNFDVLINTHIIDKAKWDHLEEHQDTLWREVQQDGISLDNLAVQPAP